MKNLEAKNYTKTFQKNNIDSYINANNPKSTPKNVGSSGVKGLERLKGIKICNVFIRNIYRR